MKKFMRIYKWIVISLMIQVLILTFFNNFYLGRRGEIVATSYEMSEKSKKDMEAKLPQEASDIKTSFNGGHAAYFKDGRIEIIEISTRKSIKIIGAEGKELLYYKWLPDRNMIIYAEKSKSSNSSSIETATYDIDSGETRSYPKITGLPESSQVSDIQLSPLTNIVYEKIKVSDKKAKIYKYDIMSHVYHVMDIDVGSVIKETNYSDKLIYQDEKNRIFVKDGAKKTNYQLSFKNKMVLLGIDSEDMIYAGELDSEKKVARIYYGKAAADTKKTWSNFALEKPAIPENVVVSREGSVYAVSHDENAIYSARSSLKNTYAGKFLDIVNGYIVSIDGNKLKLSVLKSGEGELKN